MPPDSYIIVSHLHFPLFYVLLKLTEFPNAGFAFRPSRGVPLVGEFYSPALFQRYQEGVLFTNESLRNINKECQHQEGDVRDMFSREAGLKSMQKIQKAIKINNLVGSFATQALMVESMLSDIRQDLCLSEFSINPARAIASPQRFVEESRAYQGDNEAGFITKTKVRNICNDKTLNKIATSFSTCIPNTHGNVAGIVPYSTSRAQRE